jgi:Right handed beta helix region
MPSSPGAPSPPQVSWTPAPIPTSTVETEAQLDAQIAAGGTVTLPTGNYVLKNMIHVPAGTTIRGAGIDVTQLYRIGSNIGGVFEFDGDGITVSDMTIDGSNMSATGYQDGLLDVGHANAVIQRVKVTNAPYFGAFVADAINAVIQNSVFDGNGRLGGNDTIGGGGLSTPQGNVNPLFDSNKFYNDHGTSINNTTTHGGAWTNNEVFYPTRFPIATGGEGAMLSDCGLNGVTIAYNRLHGPGGIGLSNAGNCGAPLGNIVHDNVLDVGPPSGHFGVPSGNTHYHNEVAGVYVD